MFSHQRSYSTSLYFHAKMIKLSSPSGEYNSKRGNVTLATFYYYNNNKMPSSFDAHKGIKLHSILSLNVMASV